MSASQSRLYAPWNHRLCLFYSTFAASVQQSTVHTESSLQTVADWMHEYEGRKRLISKGPERADLLCSARFHTLPWSL